MVKIKAKYMDFTKVRLKVSEIYAKEPKDSILIGSNAKYWFYVDYDLQVIAVPIKNSNLEE